MLLAVLPLAAASGGPSRLAFAEAALETGISAEWVLAQGIGERVLRYRIPAELPLLSLRPDGERQSLQNEVARIEANRKVVRVVAGSFDPQTSMRLSPDYGRTAAEVAVSIPYADIRSADPLARVVAILRALPSYARVHVVFPPPLADRVRKGLEAAQMDERAILHPLEDWNRPKHRPSKYSRSTRWIRDTFLVGQDDGGKAVAFVPLSYAQVADLTDSDLDFVHEKWFDPRRVIRFPAFVRGGNVAAADNTDRHRVAFVGEREFAINRDVFRFAAAAEAPDSLILGIMRRIAGTSRVVVLPNSEHLFHIDMTVAFLAPGLAAVIEPVDRAALDPTDLAAIDALRHEVEAAGFRVLPIPTTTERINGFQSPVNSFVFVNRTTGRREAIVTGFPDRRVRVGERMVSLNDAVRNAYATAGIRVRWVPDRLSDRHGNVHCAVLALH